MAALAAAVAVAVVAGAAQMYQSEKARGAERKRLDELKKMYEKLKPPNYDLSIEDPPELHEEALARPEFSGPMAPATFDMSKFEPEELKLIDTFNPHIAKLIKEESPTILEKTGDMREGLDAQKSALRKFTQIGEGGFDPEQAQAVQQAKDQAQAEAQSRGASIMQDFERRGMGGSGMELAAKMGAASTAMDRNAQLGLQASTDAYRNRLSALAQGAQLGGDIYNQEAQFQETNADIINSFNQRMSKRHQDWEQMRADAMNAADLRNMQEAQRIDDYNVKGRNRAEEEYRARADELAKYNHEFQMGERNRADDLNKWNYAADTAQRQYDDSREILQSKWRQDNTDRMNAFKDADFRNANIKAGNMAGVSAMQGANTMGQAQDRNAAIQGMANAGMMYYGQQNANEQRQKDRDARMNTSKGMY